MAQRITTCTSDSYHRPWRDDRKTTILSYIHVLSLPDLYRVCDPLDRYPNCGPDARIPSFTLPWPPNHSFFLAYSTTDVKLPLHGLGLFSRREDSIPSTYPASPVCGDDLKSTTRLIPATPGSYEQSSLYFHIPRQKVYLMSFRLHFNQIRIRLSMEHPSSHLVILEPRRRSIDVTSGVHSTLFGFPASRCIDTGYLNAVDK